ncbi:hypothetical protein AYO38_11705, partial [bacterium SCGC AG-212-C10]
MDEEPYAVTHTFDISQYIDSDPKHFGNRPFIRGKRVMVQTIGIDYKRGRTPEETAEARRLELAEVHAGLCYYFANKAAIDRDLQQQQQEYDRHAA